MFTKGQEVKVISVWRSQPSVSFSVRKAVVASVGKKVMKLVDAHTLQPLGNTYQPTEAQRWDSCIVRDCTMEEATETAQVLAADYRLRDIEIYRRLLATQGEDSWRRERLTKLEGSMATVVTPYEPGEEYGPVAGKPQYSAKKDAAKKYVARYNGAIVGKRRSHRTYTHAIVVETKSGPKAFNWSGSLALAQKASAQVYRGTKVLAIVDAEVV